MTAANGLRREAIYEAAYDDEAFAALPDLIRRACDARSTVMHFIGAAGDHASLAHTGHWSDEEVALYGAYSDRDLLLKATARKDRINRFWNITEDLVTDTHLKQSEIWRGFYRPIGDDTRHVLGASFDTPWGVGAIGIHRGENTSAFDDQSLAVMQELAPDLRRMLIVRSKLWTAQAETTASRAALDALSLAILQVDRNGRVLTLNAPAEALCGGSGVLRMREGRLIAEGRQASLLQVLAAATDEASPKAGMLRLARPNGSVMVLTASPLPAAGAARALVVVKVAEGLPSLAAKLREFLGLSPSEAWVAAALSGGRSLAEIALDRGVSELTVRTQLKAILNKTGCRRQGELLSLIAALPPTSAEF